MADDAIRFAGDVRIENLRITSLVTGKIFNVTNQTITIQIYEDLFSHFISGSLILQESLEFTNYFPFVGEEIIDISLVTPTLDKLDKEDRRTKIEGQFYIYKMSNRIDVAERCVVYQLHFIAIEAIVDINTKISKSYSGKISDIIKHILIDDDSLKTKKKYTIEETKNKTKYISNFWSPIRNITFLMGTSQNTFGAPTYLFFQNRHGFNYVTLDYLNGGAITQIFNANNLLQKVNPLGGSKRNIDNDYKRISELSIPVSHDYINKNTAGSFNSTMLFHDITTKRYYNLKYSSVDNWGKKENRLNTYPASSKYIWSSNETKIFNDTIATGLFNNYGDVSNSRITQKRVSRLNQCESFKINITVPGRTDYTVGQIVNVVKYKDEPIEDNDLDGDILDNIISGNYLISAINHKIDKTMHECHMELIKDSHMINLETGTYN